MDWHTRIRSRCRVDTTVRPGRRLRRSLGGTCALLLLVAFPAPSPAQEAGTSSVFSLGAGARAQALGNAFAAQADDATATFWNAAALTRVRRAEIVASHVSLFSSFSEANAFFIGIAYPTLSMGTFGVGFMRVGSSFDAYDGASRFLGEAGYAESQTLFSYGLARRLPYVGGRTAFGITGKIVHQSVEPFSSTGTGIDLGLLYQPDLLPRLTLGLNLQDLSGANLKLISVEEQVPTTFLLGAAYDLTLGTSGRVNLMLQYDVPELDRAKLHIGAEYLHGNLLAVRVGMDAGQITFGVGIGFQKYRVDYGYIGGGEAGSSHPVAFTARLGPSREEKLQAHRALRSQELEDEVTRRFRERIEDRVRAARERARARDFDGALEAWKVVLEFEPDRAEARSGLAEAQEEIRRRHAAELDQTAERAQITREFERGLDHYTRNDYTLARSRFESVLELDPENEEARAYLQRIERKIDEQIEFHRARALELEAAGELGAAISEWNRIRFYEPDHPEALAAIGRLEEAMDQIGAQYRELRTGYENLQQGLEERERRLQATNLYNQALHDYASGNLERTRTTLERLVELDPENAEAHELLRRIERQLTPLTDEEREIVRELYLAGMKHFTRDEFSRAIEEWQKILEIDPGNESIRKNIEEARLRLESASP